MRLYSTFIGIDIGKFTFVSAIFGQKTLNEYPNSPDGIGQFIAEHKTLLPEALVIAETTGGYELDLLHTLQNSSYTVHRADARKVKNFIRSFGNKSKTDALDARALALYAKERSSILDLYSPQQYPLLDQLLQRRLDLKQMLVAEKNRSQSPSIRLVKSSCESMIQVLEAQLQSISAQIQDVIKNDPILKEKQEVLKTIPGIGEAISSELLIFLPELGSLNRKQIASLAGVAPKANDSGCFYGYRRTGHDRGGVKPLLFLAAMAARRSKTPLKGFYETLISKGKKKMVALTALMRKILVIANARIRDYLKSKGVLRSYTLS